MLDFNRFLVIPKEPVVVIVAPLSLNTILILDLQFPKYTNLFPSSGVTHNYINEENVCGQYGDRTRDIRVISTTL